VVPSTHLHSVFRQAAASSVVRNAHAIIHARVPPHMWRVDMSTVPGFVGEAGRRSHCGAPPGAEADWQLARVSVCACGTRGCG